MIFVTQDGKEFDNFDKAKAHEEDLKTKSLSVKCLEDLKQGIEAGSIAIGKITEVGDGTSSILVIHNPEGISHPLKRAITTSIFGDSVVFNPKTFSADTVYTAETVRSDEELDKIAKQITSGVYNYRVNGECIILNDIVICTSAVGKVADMIEKYLVTPNNESLERPLKDILQLLFGL